MGSGPWTRPTNTLFATADFSTASVLYVPGEASDLYWAKTGQKGSLHEVWYESPTLELTRRMFVYTPPGYETGHTDFPVLYLLHGGGGDEEAWPTLGAAKNIMDNLIKSGKAKPMLVVQWQSQPGRSLYRESANRNTE